MMPCRTCGERLLAGESRCPTCGSVAPAVPSDPIISAADGSVAQGLAQCPRCGYRGQGTAYFSRAGNLALLVGVGVFTYALGGIVYWAARRNHIVCPRCGLNWGKTRQLLTGPRSAEVPALPSEGLKRRIAGAAGVLFGAFMIMMGIVEFEPPVAVVGSLFGASGSALFFWGWKSLQDRRQALTAALQRRVLRLAQRQGGTLTVSEVAAGLQLALPAAERVLDSMDDGLRVRSEVTDEGVVVYEFPEVLLRRRLPDADAAGA